MASKEGEPIRVDFIWIIVIKDGEQIVDSADRSTKETKKVPDIFVPPRLAKVLRLLPTRLSNKEIASALILSESTVKGYIRDLADLFIGERPEPRRTRQETVARAKEIGWRDGHEG